MCRRWAEMGLLALLCACLCVVATPTTASAQSAVDAPAERDSLWRHDRHWISLGVLSAAVATSAGLRLSGAQPFTDGLIGIKVREDGTLEGDVAEEVGELFSEVQMVSGAELVMFVAASGFTAMLVSGTGVCGDEESCAGRDQALLDTSLGYIEAVGATLLVTDLLKYLVARARPDYNDRIKRFECDKDPSSGACITGRLSFPSGHASMSFAAATFAALVVGGRYVWGDHVRESSDPASLMVPGILGQLVLASGATYVAVSRVLDSRHNVSDILVGAGIGIAISTLVYFTYFDADGHHFDADRRSPVDSSTATQPVMFTFGGAF